MATKLVKDGHAVALLHGELDVTQRIDVLNRFRESHEKILITTNVMARGKFVNKLRIKGKRFNTICVLRVVYFVLGELRDLEMIWNFVLFFPRY